MCDSQKQERMSSAVDEELLNEVLEHMQLEQAMAIPPEASLADEVEEEGSSESRLCQDQVQKPVGAEESGQSDEGQNESAGKQPNYQDKYKVLGRTLQKHRRLGELYLKRQDDKTVTAYHKLEKDIVGMMEKLEEEMQERAIPVPDVGEKPKQRTVHKDSVKESVSQMPADAYQHEFPKKDQNFLLYMFSHLDGRPKSAKPCFMLGGVTKDVQEVKSLGQAVHKQRPALSVYMGQMRSNQLITMQERLGNRDYVQQRMHKIVDLHKKRVQLNNAMFRRRINDALHLSEEAKKRKGPVSEEKVINQVKNIEERRQKAAMKQGYRPRKTDLEMRDRMREKIMEMQKGVEEECQRVEETGKGKEKERSKSQEHQFPASLKNDQYQYAVVVIVLDQPREGPVQTASPIDEFILHVLQCFETEEEAMHFAVHYAGKQLNDFEPLVVPMYQWIDPYTAYENLHEAAEEGWNPEMTETLNKPKLDKRRMDAFKNYCEQAGLDLPVTEVHPDGNVRGKDAYGEDLRFREYTTPSGKVIREVEGVSVGRQEDPTTRGTASILPPRSLDEDEEENEDGEEGNDFDGADGGGAVHQEGEE